MQSTLLLGSTSVITLKLEQHPSSSCLLCPFCTAISQMDGSDEAQRKVVGS